MLVRPRDGRVDADVPHDRAGSVGECLQRRQDLCPLRRAAGAGTARTPSATVRTGPGRPARGYPCGSATGCRRWAGVSSISAGGPPSPPGQQRANHDHRASVRSARPGRCRYRVRSRPRPPGTARRPAGILDEGGRRPRGASLASSRNRWSSRGFGTCTPRNAGSTHLIATAHGDERGAGTAVAPRPSMAVSPVCSLRVRGRTQPASGGRTIRRPPRSRVPSARNRYPSGSFGRCPRAPRRATIRPDTHCAGRVPWWRRHRSSSPFGMDPSRGLHERGPHR